MSEGGIPLKSLSVDQLKTVCRNKNLLTDGNKSELQKRLSEFAKDNLCRKTGDGSDFLIDPQNLISGESTPIFNSAGAPSSTAEFPSPPCSAAAAKSSFFTIPALSQDKLRKQTADVKFLRSLNPDEVEFLVAQLSDKAEMYGWTDTEALGAAHMKINHDLKVHMGVYRFATWKDCAATLKKKYGLSSDYVAALLRNFQKKSTETFLQGFQRLMQILRAMDLNNICEDTKRRMLRENLQKLMPSSLFYVFDTRWYSTEYTVDTERIEEILIDMNNVYGQSQKADAKFDLHAIDRLLCGYCRKSGHLEENCPEMIWRQKFLEILQKVLTFLMDMESRHESTSFHCEDTDPVCYDCPEDDDGELYRHQEEDCPNK